MANEAVCIEKPTIIVRRTCADGTTLSKGTLTVLTDPNTVAAAVTTGAWGGITIEEKTASDGITQIAVALDGVWDLTTTATTVTVGAQVILSGPNLITNAVEADFPLGKIIGKAEETATASEVIRVRLIGY